MTFLSRLDPIIAEVVAPAATTVDREGVFPTASVEALGEAGLLGLVNDVMVGGLGLGLAEASEVVERLGRACSSTAVVIAMHYTAMAAVERHCGESIRREIVLNRHLLTPAWSEREAFRDFNCARSTARTDGEEFILDGDKSRVVSALEADHYVWPARENSGEISLWLVGSRMAGLSQSGPFAGVGLRGASAAPVSCRSLRLGQSARLGGQGLVTLIHEMLPVHAILTASCSIGMMAAVLEKSGRLVAAGGGSNGDAPRGEIRAYLARASVLADMARALRDEACHDRGEGAALRALKAQAAAVDASLEVTGIAMRICGGAGVCGAERHFRDARALSSIPPATERLYDLIGRSICGLPVFS